MFAIDCRQQPENTNFSATGLDFLESFDISLPWSEGTWQCGSTVQTRCEDAKPFPAAGNTQGNNFGNTSFHF
jgi:hypothetical protein